MAWAALWGFVLGFFGSVPVAGPVALLVFTMGASDRIRSGLALAFGAAVAEAGFAWLAFWGLSSFLAQYTWFESACTVSAAVILISVGAYCSRWSGADFAESDAPARSASLWGSWFLGLSLAGLNPGFIATWSAAIAVVVSLGLLELVPANAPFFAVGVCLGVVGWFATLLWLLHRFRDRVGPHALGVMVRWMGWALMALGLYFAGVVMMGWVGR